MAPTRCPAIRPIGVIVEARTHQTMTLKELTKGTTVGFVLNDGETRQRGIVKSVDRNSRTLVVTMPDDPGIEEKVPFGRIKTVGDFDDIRRRVSVLSGDVLNVRVPENLTDGDHSFKSVATGSDHPQGVVTVSLQAGFTRLRIHDPNRATIDATFDGYRYFPRVPDDHPQVRYRGDVGDAAVDFDTEGIVPDSIAGVHPVKDMTVESLITRMESGLVEPLPKS